MIERLGNIAYDETRSALLAGGLFLLYLSVCVLLGWSSYPKLLAIMYPVGALVVGGWLYATQPHLYFGFVWWIWFITPFIRRVVDYLMGHYVSFSLPMLAPFFVTSLVFLDLPRFGGLLKERAFLPYAMVLLGLLYGYLVGIVKVGAFDATEGFLEWFAPALLGFHVLVFWRQYPQHRRVMLSVFTWGVLVLGIYGIYQFFSPPPWDALWMIGSGMDSIGRPEPFQVRVFSMLNAPGPYGMVLMAGLLLLFVRKNRLTLVAAVPGYVGILLSLVRGSWGGWVLGLGLAILGLRGKQRARLGAIMAVVVVLSIPIVTVGPVADQVGERAETLTDIESQGSYQARKALYQNMTMQAISNPIGRGLGSTKWDSGFITAFYQLGWLGSVLYFGGMVWLLRNAWRARREEKEHDHFTVFVSSIATVFFVGMVMATQSVGIKGAVFWSCLSLAIASHHYHSRALTYQV